MRFVNISLGCDWPSCGTVEAEDSGVVAEKTLEGRTFLLCKKHRDQLDEIHAPLLAAGVKTEPKKKSPVTRSSAPAAGPTVPVSVEMTCRVPDCGQLCRGNVGLAQHLKKRHSLTIATYNELYPEPTE